MFAYINEGLYLKKEDKSNEVYFLPNDYKSNNNVSDSYTCNIHSNKSVVVANNWERLNGDTYSAIDKLKMDISYEKYFQSYNYNRNTNVVDLGSMFNNYLTTRAPYKELYVYCSTATTLNKLRFTRTATPNDTFKNNCTKVYLPVQDVVDVESVANLHLPDTVEVIYSIPVGATCYTNLPIKYDL